MVVSLAMAPLTAFHFQQIQLAGLVTNFILIPVASFVVPLSFLLSAFAAGASAVGMGWFDKVVSLAEWLPGLLAAGMMAVTRLAASVPAGTLDVPKPGAFPIAMFLASLTVALGVRRAAIRQAGWMAVALSMAIIVWPLALASAKVTGRATLIFRTPEEKMCSLFASRTEGDSPSTRTARTAAGSTLGGGSWPRSCEIRGSGIGRR